VIMNQLLIRFLTTLIVTCPIVRDGAVVASRRPVKTIAYIEQQRSAIVARFKRYHDELPGGLKTIADMYPDSAAADCDAIVAMMRDN
jgi:hypothetical protein